MTPIYFLVNIHINDQSTLYKVNGVVLLICDRVIKSRNRSHFSFLFEFLNQSDLGFITSGSNLPNCLKFWTCPRFPPCSLKLYVPRWHHSYVSSWKKLLLSCVLSPHLLPITCGLWTVSELILHHRMLLYPPPA